MKTLFLIPSVVGAVLAAAAGICRMVGLAPHERDLIAAAVIVVIAAEAAMVPAWLARRTEPATRAQVALGGTVLHLLLTIMLAAAIMVSRVVEPNGSFALWLTGAYWLSLGMLVWGLVSIGSGRQLSRK